MPTTPGSFIPRFAFWNPSTWAIPELYWDTFSQEQRIHAICKQLGKVIAYADMLGVNTDDIAARLKAIEDGQLDELITAEIEAWFEENEPAIIAAIEALQDALPIADFDSENTVKSYVDSSISTSVGNLGSLLPASEFSSEDTVKDYIDDTIGTGIGNLEAILPASEFSSEDTVKDAIEEKATVEQRDAATIPASEIMEMFMFPEYDEDPFASPAETVIVKEDNRLKNAFFNAGYNMLAQGNLDMAETITIANTWLKNADQLVYGNYGVGIQYTGTSDNLVRMQPNDYRIDGKMPIDCNTFTQLVGHGITYNNSIYNGNTAGTSYGFHPMFNPTAPVVQQYWRYHYSSTAPEPNYLPDLGWGHMISDSFAKFLFDAGRLEYFTHVDQIVPGYIYFCGNTNGRFLRIAHCYLCGGWLGPGNTKKIVIESVSSFPGYGVISRGLEDNASNQSYTRARYLIPATTGLIEGIISATHNQVVYSYTDRNLYTDNITWSVASFMGCKAIAIRPNSSAGSNLTLTANNSITNKTISNSMTLYGEAVFYLPYNWDVTISSTSTTATFDVVCQYITSDKYLRFA